jgi:hypothetical protein
VDQRGFLERTRDGYDRTAGLYAERFHDYLDDKPVDGTQESTKQAFLIVRKPGTPA